MKVETTVRFFVLLIIGLFISSAAFADWNKARAALNQLDFAKAISELLPVAEQGDVNAQLWVGDLYRLHPGKNRDFTKGALWYKRAATQGSADGQALLATVYFHGQGTDQNYSQAKRWSEKAAKQNSADGNYILATIYARGLSVRPDAVKAKKYYKKSTELGNLPSHYYLAAMQAEEKDAAHNLVSTMALALVATLLRDDPNLAKSQFVGVEDLIYGRDVINNPLLVKKTEIALGAYDLLQKLKDVASPAQIKMAKKQSLQLFERMRRKQKETTRD